MQVKWWDSKFLFLPPRLSFSRSLLCPHSDPFLRGPHFTSCKSHEQETFRCWWSSGSFQNLSEPGALRVFYLKKSKWVCACANVTNLAFDLTHNLWNTFFHSLFAYLLFLQPSIPSTFYSFYSIPSIPQLHFQWMEGVSWILLLSGERVLLQQEPHFHLDQLLRGAALPEPEHHLWPVLLLCGEYWWGPVLNNTDMDQMTQDRIGHWLCRILIISGLQSRIEYLSSCYGPVLILSHKKLLVGHHRSALLAKVL